ncbi:MAG: hypothetical protein Q7S40_01640 [Opitutaceae bacterium]|nr:hypothetical protein [Opitutaceae bacterium]
MSPLLFRTGVLCAVVAPLGAGAQSTLTKPSPFAPAGAAATATVASETLEFAGVSSVGQKTDIIIHDKTAKRKHWIGIGETVEGISVVRYDPRLEQAVITVNGAQKTLPLRKATSAMRSPAGVAPIQTGFAVPPPVVQTMPAPAPAVAVAPTVTAPAPAATANPAPTTPATPENQAKAETEARMLVSDLLEIGMAQRKAYEEAQRKAAGGNTDPHAPVPPPQTAPTVQGQPSPPQGGQPAPQPPR